MAERHININGHGLFYEILGEGSNSLIFMHGLCGSHEVWSKNIPAFSKRYRVAAIDMFGHGNSDKEISPKEAFKSMPRAIKGIIEKEKLKNVAVIGHSIAGNVLLSCMEEKIKAKAYVFVDCTFNAAEKIVNSRNKLADTLLNESNIDAAVIKWYKTMMDCNFPKDNDLILSSFKNLSGKWALNFLKTTNFVRKVTQTNLPMLIFESDWLTKDEPERSFAKVLPHADYFHWPVLNHFFFVYEADKFNQILLKFLEKHFD